MPTINSTDTTSKLALFCHFSLAPRSPRFAFTGHWPLFFRSTPRQRGQVVRGLFPAGYCHPPTAELPKSERDPISTSGPTIFSMSPNRAIASEKSNFSTPHAAARPLTIRSWPEALNARGSRLACRKGLRRDAYPLFIAIPMSVLTIVVSHLVDRFPDGILTS